MWFFKKPCFNLQKHRVVFISFCELLCATLTLQLSLQGCPAEGQLLCLSHHMPRQGAIGDSLHHIGDLVHHQFKILQFSVHSWLLVPAERVFFVALGPHQCGRDELQSPMSCCNVALRCPSCPTRLMVTLCVPCLCSGPVAGFGRIFGCFFLPRVLAEQELTLAHQGSSSTSLWKPGPSQVLALGTAEPGMASTNAPGQGGVGEGSWAVQGTQKVAEVPLPSAGRQVKESVLSSLS